MVDNLVSALLFGLIILAAVLRIRQKRKDRAEQVGPSRRDDGPQLY